MTITAPAPILVKALDGTPVPLADDWGMQAALAAEAHLEACWRWYHAEEEEDEETMAEMGENPAVSLFCGGTNCSHTCEVHETLAAAMPFIEAGLLGQQST